MDAARPTIPGTKVARRAVPGGPWESAPPWVLSDYILREKKGILFICHFNLVLLFYSSAIYKISLSFYGFVEYLSS